MFNHSGIVEMLLTLPGVVLVMVAVSLGVLGEVTVHHMLWDRVVLGVTVVGCMGRGGAVEHDMHGTNPYPS